MNNIDDILYSPIGSEPETENNDLAQDQTIPAELQTLHNPGSEWAWRKWCHAHSQLQQNISQSCGLSNQPLQQWALANQAFTQQWALTNQAFTGLTSSQPVTDFSRTTLLNQSQQAQQTLDMMISQWWINTSPPIEE